MTRINNYIFKSVFTDFSPPSKVYIPNQNICDRLLSIKYEFKSRFIKISSNPSYIFLSTHVHFLKSLYLHLNETNNPSSWTKTNHNIVSCLRSHL